MRCSGCRGPFHPASGDYDRAHCVATCGPCHRRFIDWLRESMAQGRSKGRDFYAAAATSIRAAPPSSAVPKAEESEP